MKFRGAHIFSSGGPQGLVQTCERAKINSVQIMPTAPMRWSIKEIPEENAKLFSDSVNGSIVKKVLIHGIYLINLARKDKQMFHLSKMSVVTYLNYAFALRRHSKTFDILGVTFHPGSAKDLSNEEGLERISYGLNWIIENSDGEEMILLESSAGAGNIMGDTFEELAAMREGVKKKERVGYVLDTQHTFVSGYDWVNDLDGVVKKIDDILGIKNVKAIHLNDSATEIGSHKDRHANLGEGKMGERAIKEIVNHPKLKNIPLILETPALKEMSSFTAETKKLLSL